MQIEYHNFRRTFGSKITTSFSWEIHKTSAGHVKFQAIMGFLGFSNQYWNRLNSKLGQNEFTIEN